MGPLMEQRESRENKLFQNIGSPFNHRHIPFHNIYYFYFFIIFVVKKKNNISDLGNTPQLFFFHFQQSLVIKKVFLPGLNLIKKYILPNILIFVVKTYHFLHSFCGHYLLKQECFCSCSCPQLNQRNLFCRKRYYFYAFIKNIINVPISIFVFFLNLLSQPFGIRVKSCFYKKDAFVCIVFFVNRTGPIL